MNITKKLFLLAFINFCWSRETPDLLNHDSGRPILFPLWNPKSSPDGDDIRKVGYRQGHLKGKIPIDGDVASFCGNESEYSTRYFIGFTSNQRPVLLERTGTNLQVIRDSQYVERAMGGDYNSYCRHLLGKAKPELFVEEVIEDKIGLRFLQTGEKSAFFIPLPGSPTEESLMNLYNQLAIPVTTLKRAIDSGSTRYGIMYENIRPGVFPGGLVVVKIEAGIGFAVQTGGRRIEGIEYFEGLFANKGSHDEFVSRITSLITPLL